jgi:hypothetical protein
MIFWTNQEHFLTFFSRLIGPDGVQSKLPNRDSQGARR